jgi:hypothetical protein
MLKLGAGELKMVTRELTTMTSKIIFLYFENLYFS